MDQVRVFRIDPRVRSAYEKTQPEPNQLPFLNSRELLSKKSLTEIEKEEMVMAISMRKILIDKPVECFMMGSLNRVKMIQSAEAKIQGTILTKMSVGERGIVHHSVTLFRERLVSKAKVMEAWKLRIIKDLSSSVLFDPTNFPFKMMNTLIWNCRGAMKP